MTSGDEFANEVLPYVRPRDAATLILVRRDGVEPSVLMGKRSQKHVFMPDKYVFPGGRVDSTDARAPAAKELAPDQEALLLQASRRKPRALPLAAIRETFEETGLIIGKKSDQPTNVKGPKNWIEYLQTGALPDLNRLKFIGRAITPTQRKRRFDARFFMAEAETCLLDERPALASPELIDVQWVDLNEALSLDLPNITRFMIGEVKAHLEDETNTLRPVFFRSQNTQRVFDRL